MSFEHARERAVALLSDGYAYDVLSEEEFERRLACLGQAHSPAAIDALVADLVPTASGAVELRTGAAPIDDAGRIVAFMSETRRDGQWRVPRRLRVAAVMSTVRLDLRYALIPEHCTIEVLAFMANVTVLVPPGLTTAVDVTPVMSNVRNEGASTGDWRDPPRVRITGGAFMAEVRARLRALGR